jgi:uncharacterized membrane protein
MAIERNVSGLGRAASVAAGLALLAYARRRRSSSRRWRSAAGTLGTGLIGRGVSGYCPVTAALEGERRLDDTKRALGGRRGVNVSESITIGRPAAEIFPWFGQPDRAPRFMRDVERVDLIDERRSRWTVLGPGGMRVHFESEIIDVVDNEHVSWRTLPGADVASAGSVHLRPRGDGETEVVVRLQYAAPGGKVGAAVAKLTGRSPGSRLRDDLARLKALLEAGEVPTVDGQPAGRRRTVNIAQWVDA